MTNYVDIGVLKPTVSSYLWEIENYCAYKDIGRVLISPVFSTMHSSTEQKWCILIYPKGVIDSCKDFISVYLKYMGRSSSSIQVNVSMSLLDDKYCKVTEKSFTKLCMANLLHGFPRFEKQTSTTDAKNQILVNDTIKILVEIIYDGRLAIPLATECKTEDLPDYCRLKEFDEFEKLLEAENSVADVTFKIGKDEIKVHKAIIMSRSPVFQAMFEHNMKEKQLNMVEFTDIKFDVMKEVVRFMYAGKVNEIEKLAGNLLVAADKYCLKGLKVLCEAQLFKNLTVSNAIEHLKLAETCNAMNLKSYITKFIVRHQKHVVHMPEFQLLPVVLENEILRAIVGVSTNKLLSEQ